MTLPDNRGSRVPTISVVMPTYNRPDLLQRAIRSALAQTFQDFELIIVDDCSPGTDTADAAKAFTDPRIRYIRQPKNGGCAASRNAGIRASQPTPYIAFLDDDDLWEPTKLEKQLAVFTSGPPELGAVGCGRVDHLDDGDHTYLPRFRGWIFHDLLGRAVRGYGGPLILVRRFPGEPGPFYDETIPALEDLDFALRIARNHPLDFVPEALVHVYRDEERPHVWNSQNALRGNLRMMEKYGEEIRSNPRTLSFYRFSVARERTRLGALKQARHDMMDAIRAYPLEPRLYLWLASTMFGSLGPRASERLIPIRAPRRKHARSAQAAML